MAKYKLRNTWVLAAMIAGAVIANAHPGHAQEPVMPQDVAHGQELARANCASCHEIGLSGDSPHEKAPPFWSMFERREAATIAGMLLSRSAPKHSDMPTFSIAEKQAEDIGKWIAWVQPLAHGRRLVVDNCSQCHAVTLNDESNHAEAPPFRELSKYYPIEALEEAFAEGIESGHPDMPVFEVDIIQLQDIVAYIASIQVQ